MKKTLSLLLLSFLGLAVPAQRIEVSTGLPGALGTLSTWPPVSITHVESDTSPTATITRQINAVRNGQTDLLRLSNPGDLAGGLDHQNETHISLIAGTTSNHRRYIHYRSFDITNEWLHGVNGAGTFVLYTTLGGEHRLYLQSTNSGLPNTYINAGPLGKVYLNAGPDTTHGSGVEIWSGGATPRQLFDFSESGRLGINQGSPPYMLDIKSDSANAGMRLVATNDGYAPASILLESRADKNRGQGIFMRNTNSTALSMWFAGVPYSSSNLQYQIGWEPSTVAAPAFEAAIKTRARMTITTNGDVTATGYYQGKSAILLGTNQIVAPDGLSVMGAHLWTDGTNLCVVMQDAGGARTTNKIMVSAWP